MPEISYHRLTARDKFLVIGSDGLWDMMTPMQVGIILYATEAQLIYRERFRYIFLISLYQCLNPGFDSRRCDQVLPVFRDLDL